MTKGQTKTHPADWITVAMARLIHDHEVVFHGVASPMPVVAILLAKQLHAPNAVYLSITSGVNSQPSPEHLSSLSTADGSLLENSFSSFPLTDIFDLSARGRLDVAFLSGVQIDGAGRLNLSAIGDFHHPKVRLPGGAGSAQLLPTVKRGILWKTKHDLRSLVGTLDFVTAAGNIDAVITPLCIFRKEKDAKGPNDPLKLWAVFQGVTIEDVQKQTGFIVNEHSEFHEWLPINKSEWSLLQEIDPHGTRYSEF